MLIMKITRVVADQIFVLVISLPRSIGGGFAIRRKKRIINSLDRRYKWQN
jgi:hypothetical protein